MLNTLSGLFQITVLINIITMLSAHVLYGMVKLPKGRIVPFSDLDLIFLHIQVFPVSLKRLTSRCSKNKK